MEINERLASCVFKVYRFSLSRENLQACGFQIITNCVEEYRYLACLALVLRSIASVDNECRKHCIAIAQSICFGMTSIAVECSFSVVSNQLETETAETPSEQRNCRTNQSASAFFKKNAKVLQAIGHSVVMWNRCCGLVLVANTQFIRYGQPPHTLIMRRTPKTGINFRTVIQFLCGLHTLWGAQCHQHGFIYLIRLSQSAQHLASYTLYVVECVLYLFDLCENFAMSDD